MSGPLRSDMALLQRPEDVPHLEQAWLASLKSAKYFCLPYEDIFTNDSGSGADDSLIVSAGSGRPEGPILPFRRAETLHQLTVGERRLGRIGARSLVLLNPWMAEGSEPSDVARLLAFALKTERCDLIELGEIPHASVLRAALDLLQRPLKGMRLGRKDGVRWLIDLPERFSDYMDALSGKERRNLNWKLRKVEKDFELKLETFTRPEDVDRFLMEGERISRKTYQWNVGQKLVNDSDTRSSFRRLAEQGRLRCYLLSLDGEPRAFARGIQYGRVFHYDTPGYDPGFASYSIGTVILLHTLRDLVENTDCRVFDFGTGGDLTGFKSRFGNRSIPCNSYYILDLNRPRALWLYVAEKSLSYGKNLADRLLRNRAWRDKLKRWLRRHGDGGGSAG